MTNQPSIFQSWIACGVKQIQVLLGAIAFYTCFPIPQRWPLQFSGIARWAAVVGLLIAGLLSGFGVLLSLLHFSVWVQSALLVALWVAMTGGLHLDGAMDAADGLAVQDPQRRLAVMADSRAGAFGVMAAGIILLLKTTALASLGVDRWFALMLAASWGRWGQLVAIARYPYLKPDGKGAFHKAAIHSVWDAVPTFLLLIAFSSIFIWLRPTQWPQALLYFSGCPIALLTGAWFNDRLGGHTGDTYGAIVEWTEALVLCCLTVNMNR